jgi:plasmid stability protein
MVLAFCNMRTLYLRNVPDDVGARLEALAAREGLSLSALAVRELTVLSRRADNPRLLGQLPDLDIDPESVLADLETGRRTK